MINPFRRVHDIIDDYFYRRYRARHGTPLPGSYVRRRESLDNDPTSPAPDSWLYPPVDQMQAIPHTSDGSPDALGSNSGAPLHPVPTYEEALRLPKAPAARLPKYTSAMHDGSGAEPGEQQPPTREHETGPRRHGTAHVRQARHYAPDDSTSWQSLPLSHPGQGRPGRVASERTLEGASSADASTAWTGITALMEDLPFA